MVLFLSHSVMAGKDQFRSGILASLSLITRYHLTIIWAIEELERKHKARDSKNFYEEGYYYQMLVRKPAQKPRLATPRHLTLLEMLYPESSSSLTNPQTPEELADDMARLRVVTPRTTLPFVFFPPSGPTWTPAPVTHWGAGEPSHKRMKTGPSGFQDREEQEKKEKDRQRRDSVRRKQIDAGRLDPSLTFFIEMKSDDMSTPSVEQCSASSDVSTDYSTSPHFSPYGSPHTPHFLPHARKRSGKTRYDGFFVGDNCRAVERKSLSYRAYFDKEYHDQVYFYQRQLATAREERDWDFLEIKFQVHERPPAYQFGLREGMLCNVYHVRGRYYELCAPYAMPLEASLTELSRSRYTPLDESIAPSFYRKQVDEDQDVLNLFKGFERTIHGQLQNRFVSVGEQYRVDDGTIHPKTVTCIGRGQCAVVWQPGHYRLAFRRYAGHTEHSALQQAWIQQASYAIYEQLSIAHDPEKGALKLEEDIGQAPPMSLASTRVYSRFESLRSPDGSYSLYEIQPLIDREELVENYIGLLMQFGPDHQVNVPLYLPKLTANIKSSDRAVVSLRVIISMIMEEILSQLETVTENLSRYLESRVPGSLNIGIDPKVANYQVRFSDVSLYHGRQELVAFLSNYDGYPPNLLLFSNQDDPEKSVLFKGGELYRLLNEYFSMYGFIKAFVGRTLKLNTLDKQILKMLASIAGEIDSKVEPQRREFVKRQVLPFFLDVVNKWMADRAAKNNLSPYEPFDVEKIFAYQRDSALYHRAFRLHLLAAEVGSMINPERYSLPKAEFPVSDEQSEWLEQQRQKHLLQMVAFFAVDDIEGLQEFLMRLLDDQHRLPQQVLDFLYAFQQLANEQGTILHDLFQWRDFETLAEIIRDAFEARSMPDEEGIAQPFGVAVGRVTRVEQCRFSRGCVHSPREHSLHHLLLRRMFLLRSTMPFTGIESYEEETPGKSTELFDYRYWLEQLRISNIQLQSRSIHSTRQELFSTLLQLPRARLLAVFRNTCNRLKRRQDSRIPDQEQLLEQLQAILQQSAVEDPEDFLSPQQLERNRNSILLASLLLDHPFIWIIPPRKPREPFQIGRFRLELRADERVTMQVSQIRLSMFELEQMVLQEQATGVKHYYVLANSEKNEWSILVPDGCEGPPLELDNPDDLDDSVLEGVTSDKKKRKKEKKEPLSEGEHQRRLRYNSELRTFFDNIRFQVANTPPDHFCLLHALTVILNAKGGNVTIESLKRRLRLFIAKLLVKISLYPNDVTLAEHQLIQQFGLTFLGDMLDELFLAQGGGGAHTTDAVWGDFNLILLAAVEFGVDIPFVNLNIDHWGGMTEPTLQFNIAQPNGNVVQFNPHHQLPDIFIFFDEHPLQHWNLAFNPVHADNIVPLFHWIDPLPPSEPVTEKEIFAMEGIDISDFSIYGSIYGLTDSDLNPAHFDFPNAFPSPNHHVQPVHMDSDQHGMPFMTVPALEQQTWPNPHQQAVLPEIPLPPHGIPVQFQLQPEPPPEPEAEPFNPDDFLVPPHLQQLPSLEQVNEPELNLLGIASMVVLGARINSRPK